MNLHLLPTYRHCLKSQRHSEWPTRSVGVNLARPFKGNNIFDSSSNYFLAVEAIEDHKQLFSAVKAVEDQRSTSCGAADSAKPKASLRALGQQVPLIQRAAERRGSFAAPRLGATEVLLPKAHRLALGLALTAAPQLVDLRSSTAFTAENSFRQR